MALAVAAVFEGVLPFLSPRLFRQSLDSMMRLGDRPLRLMGLAAMVFGIALLYAARYAG